MNAANANLSREESASLLAAWSEFEQLSPRITRYLQTSESEFVSLIQALDACWNMAESMKKATAHLTESAAPGSNRETAAVVASMLEGCGVLRKFLGQIQIVSRQLALAAQDTKGVIGTSNNLQEDLAPLNHIAFHFRLESARLPPDAAASIKQVYEDMRAVVGGMKHAADSKQHTLRTILTNVSEARAAFERASVAYVGQAAASEERIHHNLDLLLTVPPELAETTRKAASASAVIGDRIREAVKVLQGHDAIRQLMEHILTALAGIRGDSKIEPGNALLLQRHQAKRVLELIMSTGNRIKLELNGVIGSAQDLSGDGSSRTAGEDQVERFEEAVDRLASLSAGVAELLDGEAEIGESFLTKIDPIRALLAKNDELAASGRAMKMLALNVLIGVEKMPSARGIGALGAWTSETAESVLKIAKELDGQFAHLAAALQSQVDAITADVQGIENCRSSLLMSRSDDKLRNSRRMEYEEVSRLYEKAAQLQKKTEDLLQSLKFIDEGSRLLEELDSMLDLLLRLYPKSEKLFDLEAASAGYTMREQHEVHSAVFGEESSKNHGRLTEPAEGQDYGDNVEMF